VNRFKDTTDYNKRVFSLIFALSYRGGGDEHDVAYFAVPNQLSLGVRIILVAMDY
jgi:hypothetical protein